MKTLTIMYWSAAQDAWVEFQTFPGLEQYYLDRGYVIRIR